MTQAHNSQVAELLDRIPPASRDAERGVLGSLLLDPPRCAEIALQLRPEDFYQVAHQKLFCAIVGVCDEQGTVDLLLLRQRLTADGDLEEVGGATYLATIVQETPVAANATYYANIVRDTATLRRLLAAGIEIVRNAHAPDAKPAEAIDVADELIGQAAGGGQRAATIGIADALLQTMDYIDASEGRGRGLSTGFADVDGHQGGLFPGELVVLAARPRMGKTSLALQIALHSATHGRHTLFVSLEMNVTELMGRALCSRATVDSNRLRTGQLDDADKQTLVATANDLAGAALEIAVPVGPLTVADVRRMAHQQKRKAGLKLLVIDYLTELTPDNERDQRHEQVGKMARALKALARELELPILCLAQLNREVEKAKGDHRPKLGHLRESGAIEQDADVVWLLHREEEYSDDLEHVGKAVLITAKNRNGPAKDYHLIWDGPTTSFSTPAPSWQDWAPTESYVDVVAKSEQQRDLGF